MTNPIRYFPCPACGASLSMSSSRMITSTIREQYAQCANDHCGGGFVLRTEVVNQLSPTSDLFTVKTKNIPLLTDTKKIAIDLAVEFFSRKWQLQLQYPYADRKKRCIAYLQENLQLSNDAAAVIVELVIADLDRGGLSDWSVDTEHYKSAVIVNECISKQHVISLRELVNHIKSK